MNHLLSLVSRVTGRATSSAPRVDIPSEASHDDVAMQDFFAPVTVDAAYHAERENEVTMAVAENGSTEDSSKKGEQDMNTAAAVVTATGAT